MREFGNYILPSGMNICSMNLDRETTFLALGGGGGGGGATGPNSGISGDKTGISTKETGIKTGISSLP